MKFYHLRMRNVFFTLMLSGSAALLYSCKDHDDAGSKDTVIHTQGGSVSSDDKNLAVTIPVNTFTKDASVSITTSTTNDNKNGVGSVYTINSDTETFTKPVTLEFKYSDADLATKGTSSEFLAVNFRQNGGSWQPIHHAVVDATSKTISVQTNHFSDWTIVNEENGYIDLSISDDTLSLHVQASSYYVGGSKQDTVRLRFSDATNDFSVGLDITDVFKQTHTDQFRSLYLLKSDKSTWYQGTDDDDIANKTLQVVITSLNKNSGGKIIGTISGKFHRIAHSGSQTAADVTVSGNFSFKVP